MLLLNMVNKSMYSLLLCVMFVVAHAYAMDFNDFMEYDSRDSSYRDNFPATPSYVYTTFPNISYSHQTIEKTIRNKINAGTFSAKDLEGLAASKINAVDPFSKQLIFYALESNTIRFIDILFEAGANIAPDSNLFGQKRKSLFNGFHDCPLEMKKYIVNHQQAQKENLDKNYFLKKALSDISVVRNFSHEKYLFIMWLLGEGASCNFADYNNFVQLGLGDCDWGYRDLKEYYSTIKTKIEKNVIDITNFFNIASLPYENSYISKPLLINDAAFDNKLDEVEIFVNIINEYRKLGRHSLDSINTMIDVLERGEEIFNDRIQHAPGYSQESSSLWLKTQQQIQSITKSKQINIPILHIMFLKLSFLADYYQIADRNSRHKFSRIMDSRLLNSAHYYLDIRNPTLDDIISLDPTTVQGFSKIKANVLVNIIPLVSGINEDPHFGLNAFFYAFFNKMHILTYTPAGSAKAHGGYLKNFMLDSIANTIIPINERGDEFLTDIQSSCLVFLSHDWMHKENYEFFFKKGEAWSYYRTLYDSVMDNRGNNQFFKADLSVLFILIHELYYNIDNHAVRVFALDSRDMKEIVKINDCRNIFEVYLASFYPSAAHLIPALAKKYEISHPLDYEISKRHGAIFEAYDMMSLLEYCGLELRYNDEEPWTWGPIVSQAIIKHLRTSEMGRKFYEKIPQYSLE